MVIIKYALRGCLGFGLGGLVLILGLHISPPRPEESRGFTGKWYGKKSPSKYAVKTAQFKNDGTFSFQMQDGKRVSGSYTETDETNITFEGSPYYTNALVSRGSQLHLGNDTGTHAQVLTSRPSSSPGGGLLRMIALPVICAIIGAAVLTAGTEHTIGAIIGFCIGSALATFMALFTMVSLQGGGKPDYAWGAIGMGISAALTGFAGGFGIRPAMAIPGAIAFAIGGTIGGIVTFWLASGPQISVPAGALLLPSFMISGLLFGAVFGLMSESS